MASGELGWMSHKSKDGQNVRENVSAEAIEKAVQDEVNVGIFGRAFVKVRLEKGMNDQHGNVVGVGGREFVEKQSLHCAWEDRSRY
jgi:hypothetical protein